MPHTTLSGGFLALCRMIVNYCWRQKAKDGQFELVALACSGNAKHNPRLRAVIFHRRGLLYGHLTVRNHAVLAEERAVTGLKPGGSGA